MNKKLIPITVMVMLVLAMIFTEVIASPFQPSSIAKPSKTPGAQATAQALKWSEKHPDQTKGSKVEKLVVKNLKGEVSSFDASQVVIKLKDDSLVTVLLNADSLIKAPKLNPNKKPKNVADPVAVPLLQVGMQVSIKAALQEDGTLIALKIRVIPGKPVKFYRVGIVTEFTPGASLTIQAKNGELSTFILTAETKYLPKSRMDDLAVGRKVTVISPRDVTGGLLTARAVVIHPVFDLAPEAEDDPED